MSTRRSPRTVTTPTRTKAEKTFTLPMTEDLHKRLRIHAATQGMTIAETITAAIEAFIEKGGKPS
jgi:predicted HicB family RNase H-like nuclease